MSDEKQPKADVNKEETVKELSALANGIAQLVVANPLLLDALASKLVENDAFTKALTERVIQQTHEYDAAYQQYMAQSQAVGKLINESTHCVVKDIAEPNEDYSVSESIGDDLIISFDADGTIVKNNDGKDNTSMCLFEWVTGEGAYVTTGDFDEDHLISLVKDAADVDLASRIVRVELSAFTERRAEVEVDNEQA